MSHTRRATLARFAAAHPGPHAFDTFGRFGPQVLYAPEEPGGGGGGGGNDDDPPEETPPEDDPPKETPRGGGKTYTQAELDRVIDERLARERRNREKELEGKVVLNQADADELTALRKERRDREAAEARRKEQEALERGDHEKVLSQKNEEIETLKGDLETTKTTERQARLEDKRVLKRESVIDLVRDRLAEGAEREAERAFDGFVHVDPETEEVYVVDDEGAPMMDENRRRLSVAAGFERWLKARPFYARATARQRGGSGTPPAGMPGEGGGGPEAEGSPEAVNGKAPIVGVDGKLYFCRSMFQKRTPKGNIMGDSEFTRKFKAEIAAAQREGRYWDDTIGQHPPEAVADQVGAAAAV